jgi:Ca2+-binding RTX toxin-like protein
VQYSYRVHIIKNQNVTGHAYIELKSGDSSKYYELNVNEGYEFWSVFNLTDNPYWIGYDGKINTTTDHFEFTKDKTLGVGSEYFSLTAEQHQRMTAFGDFMASANNGLTDYNLFTNSCITFVDQMMRHGGVEQKLSEIFTAEDYWASGGTWVWAHEALGIPASTFQYELQSLPGPHCFAAGTLILLADGREVAIEDVRAGDVVAAFDPRLKSGRGHLLPSEVVRIFENTTNEWIILTPQQEQPAFPSLRVTPGHHFLASDGSFKRIDAILADDSVVILADGSTARVSGEYLVSHEGSAEPNEWRTFNFEVAGYHTYVANGVRVHNESVLSLLPNGVRLLSIGLDEAGIPRDMKYVRPDGVTVTLNGTNDGNGNTIRVTETLDIPASSTEGSGAEIVQVRNFDSNGIEISREVVEFEYGESVIQLEHISSIIGSTLGRELGGDTLLGQVAAGTVIGAIAGNLGEFLQKSIKLSGSMLDDTAWSTDPFGDAARSAFLDFGHDLALGAINQLSSVLMAEFAESVGLDGFEGGLFTSMGGTITTQLLKNAYNVSVLVENSDGVAFSMLDGFRPTDLLGSLSGAVGGYLGSYLGSQVLLPDNPQAAIGTSIGSAVGAYIGGVVIPVPGLGSLIGSFLGNLLGTLLGNAVGADPKAWGSVYLDPTGSGNMIGGKYDSDNGGDWRTFEGITKSQATLINGIVDLIGANITSSGDVDYYQKGTTYTVYLADGSAYDFVSQHTADPDAAWAAVGDRGVMSLLSQLHISGGDPILTLAFENSKATNVSALVSDLEIANSYLKYLRNAEAINVMLKEAPKSAFAIGWVLTLMRARELGLDAIKTLTHTGNSEWNTISGTALIDITRGLDGNDQLGGEGGNDQLYGGKGDDRLNGGAGDDQLYGESGNDSLIGGSGRDWIYGGVGNDTLQGGDSHDNLFAEDGDDVLYGNAGDDTLNGGVGADTLDGGDGSDAYYVDSSADVIVENGGAGADTVYASANYILSANVEALLLTGEAGSGTGNELNNHIVGNVWNNTLNGGVGVDTLYGGYGNDAYYIDNALDIVGEALGEGDDIVHSSIDWILGANVEDLTLLDPATAGTGNELSNEIKGNSRNNVLNGAAGDDSLTGGLGDDTLHGGFDNDTLKGGAGNDVLLGDTGNDFLHGEDGNDSLSGSDGHDGLEGGAGDDTMLGGAGNDNLVGGDGADDLQGEFGNDTLVGGTGNDLLSGSDGDDSLYGEDCRDSLIGGQGHDLLRGGADEDTLDGGLGEDDLDGNDGDDILVGGEGNDALQGASGNDSLDGGAGADVLKGDVGEDTLIGGSDNDTLHGGEDDDRLDGGEGNDLLWGGSGSGLSSGADWLEGGAGADEIYGEDGDDTIVGGDGFDTLYGGLGNDSLVGGLGSDELNGGDGNDTLNGGEGLDTLIGCGGDDLLIGGPDTDVIIGGDGTDTLHLSGARSDYEIILWSQLTGSEGQTYYTIDDLRLGEPDGYDFAEVEIFNFAGSIVHYSELNPIILENDEMTRDLTGIDGTKTRLGFKVDAASSNWSFYIRSFNSADELISQTEFMADGSRTLHITDIDANQAWTSYTDTFNPSGQRVFRDYANDDQNTDTTIEWTYSETSQSEWTARITRNYLKINDAVQLASELQEFAGTSSKLVEWDLTSSQTWLRRELYKDDLGREMMEVLENDNGSETERQWDSYNLERWADFEIVRDAQGRRTSQSYNYDEKTSTAEDDTVVENIWYYGNVGTSHVETKWDWQGNMFSRRVWSSNTPAQAEDDYKAHGSIETGWDYRGQHWASYELQYFQSDVKMKQTFYNDNSTRTVVYWDYLSKTTWDQITEEYDAAGRITFSRVLNDNRSFTDTVYDQLLGASWWTVATSYASIDSPVAQPTFQVVVHDNQFQTHTVWDLHGANWSTYHLDYDNLGRLINETYNYDDGLTVRKSWDHANHQGWWYLETHTRAGYRHYEYAQWDDGKIGHYWWNTPFVPQEWREKTEHHLSGHTIFRSVVYHGGTRIDQKWDPNNMLGETWSRYYWEWNTSGRLVSQYYVKDNGQVVRIVGPVAIDLNGDGISLEATQTSNVKFDWDGDGVAESTGWVGSDDGFLVIDLGGDGVINQQKEIVFTDWVPYSTSDMEALAAAFDTNKDNLFNADDARWSEFRIWQDANQNGQSDEGELQTLDNLGISSISLNLAGEPQSFADGSMIHGTSTVTFSNGRQTNAGDVALAFVPEALEDYQGAGAQVQMSSTDSEVIAGTSKRDAFLFLQYFGHDTVTGFKTTGNADVIIFSKSVFTDFTSVMASAAQVGEDVLIEADDEHSLVLKNVALANLQADDFRFMA